MCGSDTSSDACVNTNWRELVPQHLQAAVEDELERDDGNQPTIDSNMSSYHEKVVRWRYDNAYANRLRRETRRRCMPPSNPWQYMECDDLASDMSETGTETGFETEVTGTSSSETASVASGNGVDISRPWVSRNPRAVTEAEQAHSNSWYAVFVEDAPEFETGTEIDSEVDTNTSCSETASMASDVDDPWVLPYAWMATGIEETRNSRYAAPVEDDADSEPAWTTGWNEGGYTHRAWHYDQYITGTTETAGNAWGSRGVYGDDEPRGIPGSTRYQDLDNSESYYHGTQTLNATRQAPRRDGYTGSEGAYFQHFMRLGYCSACATYGAWDV
ncbi:hypothetical protein B0T25DRAFT_571090 [Lasiosphaeria hispida]|uniref:Uncharacterized protein n=1 Tax=Lasiosphaeria hispida TaxID=260671 RepID=A0AAJ0MA60_9PEZI|nr:hypothetical protein B0T25DRAFT_571090 [Lasiosphaeria hispida]